MATIPASDNEFPEVKFAEGAAPGTPAAGLVIEYAKADGLLYSKDDAGVETALGAAAHIADTADAHDASAISIADAGTLYTATDVEAALQEVMAAVGAGGIPATIFDAQGDLIVASAADTAARLALGASGTVLTSNGTTAAWAAATGGDNPMPTITEYASQFSAGSTSCAVTTSASAIGSNLVAVVYSTGRGANSITQTNVTWTKLYTNSGTSQFIEVWTGVVAGGTAGTTATAAFTGSNTQFVEVFNVTSAANFTASTGVATATGTGATAQVNGATTAGTHYIWAVCAASPTSSISHGTHPYRYLSFTGGQGRGGMFVALGNVAGFTSVSSSSTNYFAALVSIT